MLHSALLSRADHQMRYAFMGVRQVEAMFVDIVQTAVNIDACMRLIPVHLGGLERRPRATAFGKIGCILGSCKTEHASRASENINLHHVPPLQLFNDGLELYML
ncbi:hypothetical protein CLG96_06585 [Sphingomonas oleivorans]|uniref:Uncharacterized protein n=1 Tax=Sphingomonas oleivorans TaxID=1735121 RepID=A0A2T5FZT7_9SPHN|nr:hypothetical protein CLG96_06585 [Sphingomonas oleivorans]